jgi:AraC family transcriptional regulator
MNCGFCKQATECGRKECFHFPDSMEGFVSFEARDQQLTRLHSLISLRTVLRGECIYRTGGQEYRVREGDYLLMNAGDEFDLTILDQQTKIVTVCFDQARAADIHDSSSRSDESLLNGYDNGISHGEVYFPHGVSRADFVRLGIHSLMQARERDHDEIFSDLFHELVAAHSREIRSIADLEAKRASVRVEIHRRLQKAVEFIEAHALEEIDVERTASAAAMSKHHFIRSFKQAHGRTPYRYLLEHRLSAARAELQSGARSITWVAQKYRFADVQSFSKSFKQFFHQSPSSISKQHS